MQEIPMFNMIVFAIAALWWFINGIIWESISDNHQIKSALCGIGIATIAFIFAAIMCYDKTMSFRYNYDVITWQFIYLVITFSIGALSLLMGQWLVQKISKSRFRFLRCF
jgi:hypothetical protein